MRVAKVPGAKWRLAHEIVARLPQRPIYVEPFFGSGAILMNKPRWPSELINDIDGRVVALFRTLRDRPQDLARAVALTPFAREEWEDMRLAAENGDDGEREGELEIARRFLVLSHMSHGALAHGKTGWRNDAHSGRGPRVASEWSRLPARIERAADRFRGVMIECRPAIDILERYAKADVAIAADPPYPRRTVHGTRRRLYRHEMIESADHGPLLDLLIAHPGPVVACSYRNDLYDARLLGAGWEVVELAAQAEHGAHRDEALYLNRATLAEAPRQLVLAAVAADSRRALDRSETPSQ